MYSRSDVTQLKAVWDAASYEALATPWAALCYGLPQTADIDHIIDHYWSDRALWAWCQFYLKTFQNPSSSCQWDNRLPTKQATASLTTDPNDDRTKHARQSYGVGKTRPPSLARLLHAYSLASAVSVLTISMKPATPLRDFCLQNIFAKQKALIPRLLRVSTVPLCSAVATLRQFETLRWATHSDIGGGGGWSHNNLMNKH